MLERCTTDRQGASVISAARALCAEREVGSISLEDRAGLRGSLVAEGDSILDRGEGGMALGGWQSVRAILQSAVLKSTVGRLVQQ